MGCTGNDPGAPPKVEGPGAQYEDFINAYSKYGDERAGLVQEDLASQQQRLQGIEGLQEQFYSAAESGQDRQIRETLGQQILGELQLDAQLDPSLRREVQQGIRQGQTARGMGYGGADQYEEVLGVGLEADALRRRRQQGAMSYLRNQAATGPSIMSLMGGAGGTGSAGFNALLPQAMAQGQQAALMNAQNEYNYATQQAAKKAQQVGGGLKMLSGDALNLTGVQEGGQNMYYGY